MDPHPHILGRADGQPALPPARGEPARPPDHGGTAAHPETVGLSTAEARARFAACGANAVPEERPNPLLRFAKHFWAPVPWMLEAAIALQAVLGERLEASVIGGLLVFNAALAFAQEGRAEAALAALRSRLALTASVRRDGVWRTVPAAELVPADVVKLTLGGVVPADVRLLAGSVLLDQSMLTGESVPSEAGAGAAAYAGALVRRGEAVALVTATGVRTYSGSTAELVRTAHAASGEQHAILAVVRNIAVLNGALTVLMVGYGEAHGLALGAVIPLVLTAILASVPVALPATFTLAAALGAQRLVHRGVLPTRLAAVEEAAAMDVLCSDKTGTLTQNALSVLEVVALAGFSGAAVLQLAALASAEGGQDPVDGAIRAAAAARPWPASGLRLLRFVPFDPAAKRSEAMVERDGTPWRVLKGAPAALAAEAAGEAEARSAAARLSAAGSRVLAVAAGPPGALRLAGLVALSDPPRADAAGLIERLRSLGVRTVMVTGDAKETAAAVAEKVGLLGSVCPAGALPTRVAPSDYAVFAGVFPEDKYRLVKAFQAAGHTVGMCGDGANDAPALRQAQIGIAVSTATDVAKSAAGVVLTEPGLGGIVEAVAEGRATFQRILTYALTTLVRKIETVAFLALGLVATGRAVMTPMLMVLFLVTTDFLTMSITTDRARRSSGPEAWRVGAITAAAGALGLAKLAFSGAVLAFGRFALGLGTDRLRTLAFVTLVFGGQGLVFVVRERRRLWSSAPSGWMVASTVLTIAGVAALAAAGLLMAPLPIPLIAGVLAAAAGFTVLLDFVKQPVFAWTKLR